MSKNSDDWDNFTVADVEPVSDSTPQSLRKIRDDGSGVRWSLVAGLIFVATIAVLAAQNTQRVTLHFLGWNGRAPLIAIILGTVVVAILFDEAVGFVWRRRRRKTLAERKELDRLRSERLSD